MGALFTVTLFVPSVVKATVPEGAARNRSLASSDVGCIGAGWVYGLKMKTIWSGGLSSEPDL